MSFKEYYKEPRIIDPGGRVTEKKQDRRKKSESHIKDMEVGLDRRDFLKKAIIGTAALTTGVWGISNLKTKEKVIKEEIKPQPTEKKKIVNDFILQEPEEDFEITEEEARSIKEIINFNQKGKITIDEKSQEALANYFFNECKNNRNTIFEYLERLGEYHREFEETFKKYGLDEELALLSVTESGCRNISSRKDARGWFQFMERTAREFSLAIIPGSLDERNDPQKCCEAAAKFLTFLMKRAGGDLKLALHGYNGRYMNDYLKGNNGGKANSDDFFKFMEAKINKERDRCKKMTRYIYTIKKGDTIEKISRRYKSEINEILKHHYKLKVGQKISIPTGDTQREIIFYDRMKYYMENLYYPPKLIGLIKFIKSEGITIPEKPTQHKKIKHHQELKYDYYTLDEQTFDKLKNNRETKHKKLENIAKLVCRKYPELKTQPGEIMAANIDLNEYGIKVGTKFKVPIRKLYSLGETAAELKTEPENLLKKNPAFLHKNAIVPPEYTFRV